jgi:hypothetical protein
VIDVLDGFRLTRPVVNLMDDDAILATLENLDAPVFLGLFCPV